MVHSWKSDTIDSTKGKALSRVRNSVSLVAGKSA